MHLKVLFIVFLCFFSASIIYSVATVMMNVAEGLSHKAFSRVHVDYLFDSEVEPLGDGRGGGWPR